MKEYVHGRDVIGAANDATPESQLEQELQQEFPMDFTPEELHEFLAADLIEVPTDPAFKERLRSKLWAIVRERHGESGASADVPPSTRVRPKGKN